MVWIYHLLDISLVSAVHLGCLQFLVITNNAAICLCGACVLNSFSDT